MKSNLRMIRSSIGGAAIIFVCVWASCCSADNPQRKATLQTDANRSNGKIFVHPGIAHSPASIEFVKVKIAAGEQPWSDAWQRLQESRNAGLDYRPNPRAHVERGASNNPNIGSSEFSGDASAAYTQSLRWVLSGDERHARKAAEIIDAWSGTLKTIKNHDAKLLVGMDGHLFCNAAELLRHTWDG